MVWSLQPWGKGYVLQMGWGLSTLLVFISCSGENIKHGGFTFVLCWYCAAQALVFLGRVPAVIVFTPGIGYRLGREE